MAGIYIHIPFCKQKCTYCDFHFSTSFEAYRTDMIKAIAREIEIRSDMLLDQKIQSIYFGGGTPSLLKEEEFQLIFQAIRSKFKCAEKLEVTLESNPDDINESNLKIWKKQGFNRLSIGIQSFKESDLKWMNRAHSVSDSLNCIQLAQKCGFENITADLIYGLPELGNDEWKLHIQKLVGFGVNHISAYCLTVEEKTLLHNLVQNGKIVPASENQQAEQFLILSDYLTKNGFVHYEISNFCKPGYEAVHNSNYWKGAHYLGVGPSAHSFDGGSRSWNIRNNQKYIQLIQREEGWFEVEKLSKIDLFNELLLTGLRTNYGVDLDRLSEIQLPDDSFWTEVEQLVSLNLAHIENKVLLLTKQGRLQADRIASDLFLLNN